MTYHQRVVVRSWSSAIRRAIQLGEADSAYRLTVGFMRRLFQLGVL